MLYIEDIAPGAQEVGTRKIWAVLSATLLGLSACVGGNRATESKPDHTATESGPDHDGVGEPCENDSDCGGDTQCHSDTTSYVLHGVCTAQCSSDADCEVDGATCLGGWCGLTCGAGCPDGAVCSNEGICENAEQHPICGGEATACSELTGTACTQTLGCKEQGHCELTVRDLIYFREGCYTRFDWGECSATPGCYWVDDQFGGSCEGEALGCDNGTHRELCESIEDCGWVDEGCGGVAQSCDSLSFSQCQSQAGCSAEFPSSSDTDESQPDESQFDESPADQTETPELMPENDSESEANDTPQAGTSAPEQAVPSPNPASSIPEPSTVEPPEPDPTPSAPEPVAPAEPATPVVDPPIEIDPIPPAPPPGSALWLYSYGDVGSVLQVLDSDQKIDSLPLVAGATAGKFPWSRPGTELVRLVSGSVQFWALGTNPEPLAEVPVDDAIEVLSMLPGRRALVAVGDDATSQLVAIGIDGSRQTVSPVKPSSQQYTYSVAISHSASELMYTMRADADLLAYQAFRVELGEGTLSPVALGLYESSPPLSLRWNADQSWLLYIIEGTGPDAGAYAWRPGSGQAPAQLAPADYRPTPLLEFAPVGNRAYLFMNGASDSLLSVVTTTQDTLPPRLDVASGVVSPGLWSPGGTHLLYTFDGEEMIHSFDADGASRGSRPFEAFDYNCFVSWFGEDTLLQLCSTFGTTEATLITISDTAENATPSPGRLAYVSHSEDGTCWAEWEDTQLRVASKQPLTFSDTGLVRSTPVSNVVLAPDDSGIAWSEGAQVYWMRLEQCAPVTDPVLLDTHATDVMVLRFLPY